MSEPITVNGREYRKDGTTWLIRMGGHDNWDVCRWLWPDAGIDAMLDEIERLRAESTVSERWDPDILEILRAFAGAYPEAVFPTPPEELRAKDAAAADVMRSMALPWIAKAADEIERLRAALERIEASGAYPEAAIAEEALRHE